MFALTTVGLFAGIGGIEVGLHQAGHQTSLLCDFDAAAQAVLADRFPGVPLVGDVRELIALPNADLVCGGFPCQDLSQAGRTAGISGSKSGVVSEVFRLLRKSKSTWLALENVPFMLQLERGSAMTFLVEALEELGFSWAYRVVDTRAFGLPQRRQRVILLASRTEDPRSILFQGDEPLSEDPDWEEVACGFYWTEGLRGLGWAVDAIPTLKSGSTIGIPSPPAIRFPDGFIGTPDIRDAERLQGFDVDWTIAADDSGRRSSRWKLVGNAVSVPVGRWLGEALAAPVEFDPQLETSMPASGAWPRAAFGSRGARCGVAVGSWPVRMPYTHLEDFLEFDAKPLSRRATEGFLRRAEVSTLTMHARFLEDIRAHLDESEALAAA